VNEEDGNSLQVTAFDQYGFYVNEKLRVLGPVIMFPKAIFSWNIADVDEINKNSLSLFKMLEPKVDILIIGIGSKNTKVSKEVPKWLIENKINNFEILPTVR
jgi:NADH dehydrogenase [ubiquinone] 1 alpha subcomplex assembly factor 3